MTEVVGDNVVAITPATANVADAVSPGIEEIATEITAGL